MKKIVILFSFIFAVCSLNAQEAIKGFDNGMQYKSGSEVAFSFDGVQIYIGSTSEYEYSAKMIADDHAGNIFGHLWQVEGPEGAAATMTFVVDKSLLQRNGMPEKFTISRVHDGLGYEVPQENISIFEDKNIIEITISNIDQFSIWGVFDSNPPVPTLSEWAVIIFIGLLAGVGGWFVWRRLA